MVEAKENEIRNELLCPSHPTPEITRDNHSVPGALYINYTALSASKDEEKGSVLGVLYIYFAILCCYQQRTSLYCSSPLHQQGQLLPTLLKPMEVAFKVQCRIPSCIKPDLSATNVVLPYWLQYIGMSIVVCH